MMLIPTVVRPSPIQGLGLFAASGLAAGTSVWEFVPGFDRRFTVAQFRQFPPRVRTWLNTYVFWSRESGWLVFPIDDWRYMNHAEQPNLVVRERRQGEIQLVAQRRIERDEELTYNYDAIESKALHRNVRPTWRSDQQTRRRLPMNDSTSSG